MKDTPQAEYLTTKEVSEILRLKPATVAHYYARAGLIPFFRVKRRLFFKKENVIAFVESNGGKFFLEPS